MAKVIAPVTAASGGTTGATWIYRFEEGSASMRDLLGGKGAGLAEMTRAGLPVPDGFTITTEACLAFYRSGRTLPAGLDQSVRTHMAILERNTRKSFGGRENPLLVSVRSGARVSMPGMMDTILNLGLNDQTVEGLAALTGNPRFAWDAYRRFVQMFGKVVLSLDGELFEHVISERKRAEGVKSDPEVSAEGWRAVVTAFKSIIERESGTPFPQDVHAQLFRAIEAVFDSWNSKRAIDYRRFNKFPDDWGTAVNVVSMVFGNMGDDSGTGVAFTRNPSTGERKLFGEYLSNAQGEDVVAGIRTPMAIAELEQRQPGVYRQFMEIAGKLERHYRDMQDMEFTVERGKLYMLQTRNGKRAAEAAVKIALDMVDEELISRAEALRRVDAESLNQLFHARIDPHERFEVAATGLNASPGAATGAIVLDADTAVAWAREGRAVVLVREETAPDDVHGMIAAQGVLTAKGGATSHAAVVARGMGKPCVAGCEVLTIDSRARTMTVDGTTLNEGDAITIDGTTGKIILRGLTLISPPSELPAWLARFLGWADDARRLDVWANADTPEDARRARDLGARGIGLCRTEHMLFGEDRLPIVREMILSDTPAARALALARLLPIQRDDFAGILEAMAGYTVTIRLLDPPLHEFLPSYEALLVETTELRIKHGEHDARYLEKQRILERVRQLHEQNPMLGFRVCRLGIVYPEIYAMQVRAVVEAAATLRGRGVDARPAVMIPGVGNLHEMEFTAERARATVAQTLEEMGAQPFEIQVGTMIEFPRACVVADQLASVAEFFSFGTNDLTQTTLGYSRDDAENSFIPHYLDLKILEEDPFQALDREGVGALMRIGVERGRSTRAKLKIGICGEHGGDPSSVAFCDTLNLDYVSCSPYRVPIARLAAAQAALEHAGKREGADQD
ncbi:pyruvate, phosphate dikinase [bacterium]|nr:MAG: pyruvate, phosphate dikinase [bacterium]